MKTTHKTEDWFIDDGTYDQFQICCHEGVLIATIAKQDPQSEGTRCLETERNYAHLIASAPRLLAALEELLASAESSESYGEQFTASLKSARIAIKKATGELA